MWRQIGGGRYYVKSERQDGRVVQRYWGHGEAAEIIAALDQLRAQQQAQEREARRFRQERLDAITGALDAGAALIDGLLSEALPALGYRKHRPGQWRRARMPETLPAATMTTEEAYRLFEKAAHGDAAARARTAEFLQVLPETRKMVSVTSLARRKMAEVISAAGSAWEHVWAADTSLTAAELAGADASPLEHLLAGQVAMAQLSLGVADHILADAMCQRNMDALDLLGRHQERQHRRLMQSIRTLALVRRMGEQLPVTINEVTVHADTCHVGDGAPAPLGLEGEYAR